MYLKNLRILIIAILFLTVTGGYSQNVPQGINYQAIALDALGNTINNTAISIRIGILSGSSTGTLEWQETHLDTTNQFGLFHLTIGQGTSTGAGSVAAFNLINWGATVKYLKVEMDATGGSSYTLMDNSQLLSVPYALYAQKSGSTNNPVSLNDLTDADTTGTLTGKTLKWNGVNWVPANDNNSDTAVFATNQATNDWHITGNTSSSSDYIGSNNAMDLVLKTNNAERMRITSAGKIGMGITTPLASVHIVGNDGFISQGTFGSGTVINPALGSLMEWYPKKAAFRAGFCVNPSWNDANVGNYSFATGYSCSAIGYGSVSMGQQCQAGDTCGVSMGRVCNAGGKFSVALGNQSTSTGAYSISIGRGNLSSGIASSAIGYHVDALGDYSTGLGYYTIADGAFSTALGTQTTSGGKTGSFIWADNTDYGHATDTINYPISRNTANNQFWVKASGGTIFYSTASASALNSVSLPPGAGSWVGTSDRNKKEHFRNVDGEMILNKISSLEITSWNYKTQSSNIRHIGPMAQDLYEALHFGESDTTITSLDIDGINMIAVQALAKRTAELKEKAEEVEQLRKQVSQLTKEKGKLEKRIDSIEKELKLGR